MSDAAITYLDNAASTRVRSEAIEAMMPMFSDCFGNPSGAHRMARDARRCLDDARDVLAVALGCAPGDICFTAGGTEADNLAVFGVHQNHGGVVACSAIEHHAVLNPVEELGGRILPVLPDGRIDLDALPQFLDDDVSLVSVMLVNNETGVIQPLAEVARLMRKHAPNAVLHTDAVQGLEWLDVAEAAADADLISIAAHKFGGPKGIGALVVRNGAKVSPRIIGGGQERGLRSGTQNAPGIVAMAAAAQLTMDERDADVLRLGALRDRLADGIKAAVPGTIETGVIETDTGTDRSNKVAGNCHLCFEGIESEALLFLLEREGILASAASSCASGAQDPSHVLAAMGYARELAAGSLRLSLGHDNTDADIDHALVVVPAAIERLRSLGS